MRIGIVVSEFNSDVTDRMRAVAEEHAARLGIQIVYAAKVPGAFDMPLVVDALLRRDDVDGVVTLGAVIKGQTKHDEVISYSTAKMLSELSVRYGKPVSLGITGPGMHERQAYARIRPVSERAVEAVLKIDLEMAGIRK